MSSRKLKGWSKPESIDNDHSCTSLQFGTVYPQEFPKAFVISLQLKPATLDMLPAIVELDQRSLGGLWSLDGYQRELDSPNSELLVLQQVSPDLGPGSLVGIGCYWAIVEEAHITVLGIAPEYQRQGLGQTLLYALLASAHKRGLERATLEVRISNQSARALYEKFGFQEAGKRRRYYQDTGEDALVLWRGGLQYPQFSQDLQVWKTNVQELLSRSGWELTEA